MSEAQTHVAIADIFPFMQSWPQYRVLEAKEYVEQLPEVEHKAIGRQNQYGAQAQ